MTPLHFAAHEGHVALASDLLKRGAEVNSIAKVSGSTILFCGPMLPSSVCYPDSIPPYLPELLQTDRTPLHLAAYYGRTDVALLLLDRGADVGARADVSMVVGLSLGDHRLAFSQSSINA